MQQHHAPQHTQHTTLHVQFCAQLLLLAQRSQINSSSVSIIINITIIIITIQCPTILEPHQAVKSLLLSMFDQRDPSFHEHTPTAKCRALNKNFVIMSVAFAINISCVISCLSYATAILGHLLGNKWFYLLSTRTYMQHTSHSDPSFRNIVEKIRCLVYVSIHPSIYYQSLPTHPPIYYNLIHHRRLWRRSLVRLLSHHCSLRL
jgi:hypothetical protein